MSGNNKNSAQDLKILSVKKDVDWIQKEVCGIKNDIASIKKCVFNEIPHKIQELKDEFNSYKESNSKWMIGILTTLIFLLVGIIISIFK